MQELVGILYWAVLLALILYGYGLIWWKIFAKTGRSPATGLLMFVPVLNLILLCVLAFKKWPVHREMDKLRRYAPPRPNKEAKKSFPL
jgi:hypothetical protein